MKAIGILAVAMVVGAHGEVITEAPEADLPVGSTAEPVDANAKQAATTTTEAPGAVAAAVEIGICGYDVSAASQADLDATTDAAVQAMIASSDLDASSILDSRTVDDPEATCSSGPQSGAAKTIIILLPTADVDAIVASASPLTFDATIGGTTVSVTSTASAAEVTIDPTLEGKAFCCTQVCVGGGKKGKKDKKGKEGKGKEGKKGKKGNTGVAPGMTGVAPGMTGVAPGMTGVAPVTATCDCSVCPAPAKKGKKDKKGKKSKLGQLLGSESGRVASGVAVSAAMLGLVAGLAVVARRRSAAIRTKDAGYRDPQSTPEVPPKEILETAPLISTEEIQYTTSI